MKTSFENKVALVTGGTSGIGKAAALALATAGTKVVVAGRRENEGRDVVEAIEIDRFVGEAKTNNPQRDWLKSVHPVGRLGTVEEAAQAVVAMLENPFVTGSVLTVDGGWTAQ